ncbi:MAG: transporter, partial [Burkholderiales bacterium]|nr:transporter [Burkholderiales bacterium]
MKKRNNFFTTLLTVLALHGTCSNAFADDAAATDIAITPYRPSVSNSAQLPAEGQLELEMGMASARTEAARNQSLPYLLKLAFSKEWGVLLGGVAHVINDDGAGQRDQGFGDTTLVIKRAFLISDDTALGLELGNKFPTARQPLGTGQSDWSMNGIVSQDMGNIHVDVNLNASHLGAADQGTSHWQSGLSSSVST